MPLTAESIQVGGGRSSAADGFQPSELRRLADAMTKVAKSLDFRLTLLGVLIAAFSTVPVSFMPFGVVVNMLVFGGIGGLTGSLLSLVLRYLAQLAYCQLTIAERLMADGERPGR